jgi:hypothetical protein
LKVLLGVLLSVGCSTSASASDQAANGTSERPTITFDADATTGTVSPLLFGATHRWVSEAAGSADPTSRCSTIPGAASTM